VTIIQLRRGTTSQWETANPVLAAGEPGWDLTLSQLRVGDGTTAWEDLPVLDVGSLSISDISGLQTALDGKVNDTGDTIAGDLIIAGSGKGYRLRASGSALDLDGTGADLFVSVFSGATFNGTQRAYMRLESGAAVAHLIGPVVFNTSAFGGNVHTIDPVTGEAKLGAKNSLANWVVVGRRATAGPPTTGTWATDDLVLDSAGALWACTAGGTPGTWTSPTGYVASSTITGTTYTYAAADIGTVKETTNGSAVAVTVPQFAAGAVVETTQYGAGQITFAGDTGVTLRSASGLKTRAQYSAVVLRWRSATEVMVSGDLTT
jgi:hypothetical protein